MVAGPFYFLLTLGGRSKGQTHGDRAIARSEATVAELTVFIEAPAGDLSRIA